MSGPVKSIFRRPWHLICVLWFVMHIPTTILVDGQSGERRGPALGRPCAARLRRRPRASRSQPPPPLTPHPKTKPVIPAEHYPKALRDLVAWHIRTNGDFLVRDNPLWFASLVWCELLLQLPFFFVAAYAFVAGKNWIRAPAIMYGAHAATTLVPILAELALSDLGKRNPQRGQLLMIYGAYLAVPLAIAVSMAASRIPFPSERKKKVA
jgi:hypothetical protein